MATMPTKTKLTDEQIVERLAVKGMGWKVRTRKPYTDGLAFLTDDRSLRVWWPGCLTSESAWNPLADLNAIHEVEARLTEEQRIEYLYYLEYQSILGHGCVHRWEIRHADARTCALALYRVLEGDGHAE